MVEAAVRGLERLFYHPNSPQGRLHTATGAWALPRLPGFQGLGKHVLCYFAWTWEACSIVEELHLFLALSHSLLSKDLGCSYSSHKCSPHTQEH